LEAQLLEYLTREILDGDPVARATALFSSGRLDSMNLVNLATFVERSTGIAIPDSDINADHFEDVGSILAYVRRRLEG
jgi:acyl carrier protein